MKILALLVFLLKRFRNGLKKLSLVEENLYRCSSNAYDSDFQLGCLVGISQQEINYLKKKNAGVG